jgi:hypothetical protein
MFKEIGVVQQPVKWNATQFAAILWSKIPFLCQYKRCFEGAREKLPSIGVFLQKSGKNRPKFQWSVFLFVRNLLKLGQVERHGIESRGKQEKNGVLLWRN